MKITDIEAFKDAQLMARIDADGRKFSFYIFAISREHAACVVDDIRETAWLGDELVG